MHQSISNITKLLIVLFSLVLLVNGCNENITPPVNEDTIVINFPIGKKAVYAVGTYFENKDSLSSQYLSIYSLQFDAVQIKDNVTEYVGRVEEYNKLFNNPDSIFIGGNQKGTGEITVSIDNKWVLFQHSDVIGSYQIFMKRNSTTTDTTLIPTLLASQFPTFPKTITSNTNYSIYRPGSDSFFIPVQRDFEVHEAKTWTDIYGSSKGLYCKTEHHILSLVINFNAIIDSNGIVTSRSTMEDMIISTFEYPNGIDTVTSHTINRRIVDFTEPENIKDLSWYADYVSEHGLSFLEDQ